MSLNIKEISLRQQRVLRKLAEGLAPQEVARQTGYRPEHISRLSKSPQAQLELRRLHAEIEEQLALELPVMFNQALSILTAQLTCASFSARTEAAKFVLRHLGKPFLERMASLPDSDSGQTFEIKSSESPVDCSCPLSQPNWTYNLDDRLKRLLTNLVGTTDIQDIQDNLLTLLEYLPNAHPLKVDLQKAQTIDEWAVWQTAAKWHKHYGVKADAIENLTDQHVDGDNHENNNTEIDFNNQCQGVL